MKSIQALRVDSTKQQLLESRMTSSSTSPTINAVLNTGCDSNNSMNNIIETATKSQLYQNQQQHVAATVNNNQQQSSCSETTNEFNNNNSSENAILKCVDNENNSSSSACQLMHSNNNNNNCSLINVITETTSSQQHNININAAIRPPIYTNNTITSELAAATDAYSSPNRQPSVIAAAAAAAVKRRRKAKMESPNSKKICNRTEKRIDEIFKTQPAFQQQQSMRMSPYRNSCSDSSGDSTHEAHPVATPPIISSTNNKLFFNTSLAIKRDLTDAAVTNRDLIPFTDHNNENPKPAVANSSDSAIIHTQNNDSSVLSLKGKLENLEQELETRSKENEQLKDYRRKAREVLIKTLMQQSELERRATRERVNNNKLHLGQFKSFRQGAHYEEKWSEGLKYQDLEKKRKWIEEQRDENEKRKKMWNKRKPASEKTKQTGKQKGSPELEPNEFYWQAEIHDIRKVNINKEEKDLQAETERLDRERNLHIREIKRIDNEEASRFRDFPILNDRYLILSLLGKGGFSEVHKGFDLEQLCFVACKIHELNPSWPQDKKDSYIKHALREISIHKRLDHRRIVRVHDVFNIDNDAFCTVLEYCEGNDLDFYLKQNKCIPERDAKSLICQLVSALRYLNDRKNPIIHYDLKPGNILLCNNGEIKITDFGLSKIFPDDHHNPEGMELTSQGAGTYWYLPPECFVTENGPPTISSKVDVWSVGVIFYQSLYGKKPFGNNMTQTDILHNNTILQARNINFPSFPKISDGAKDFIRRCCTYRKELRPDVFQLCNDDYLKPKAQLKHSVDVAVLPGPSSGSLTVPPHSTQSSQITSSNHY